MEGKREEGKGNRKGRGKRGEGKGGKGRRDWKEKGKERQGGKGIDQVKKWEGGEKIKLVATLYTPAAIRNYSFGTNPLLHFV